VIGLLGGGRVTIERQYGLPSANLIESLRSSDTVLDLRDGSLFVRPIVGGASSDSLSGSRFDDRIPGRGGDDVISGDDGDNWLDGGGGGDVLSGGSGDDTYVPAGDFGTDIVTFADDGGRDTLRFLATSRYDASFHPTGDGGLVVTLPGRGSVTVLEQHSFFDESARIERAVFVDGTVDLTDAAGLGAIHGSAASDDLRGTGFGDRIEGVAGDDVLRGGPGDDVLVGGPGNDRLLGDEGADLFIFGGDFGNDTVFDDEVSDIAEDIVQFEGYRVADAVLTLNGDSLRITLGTSSVLIGNQYASSSRAVIETALFSDGRIDLGALDPAALVRPVFGTSAGETLVGSRFNDDMDGRGGDDTIRGNGGNDRLAGGPGDDMLVDDGGNDLYVFAGAFGNDRVEDRQGDDVLRFLGFDVADASFARDGDDLVVTLGTGSVRIIRQFSVFAPVTTVEMAVFDDGEVDLSIPGAFIA